LIQKQKQNKQQYEKHQTQFTYPVVWRDEEGKRKLQLVWTKIKTLRPSKIHKLLSK
jgi:hypothetical protein